MWITFLTMSINLVTLNHWFWSHLNAVVAGTCLNNINVFVLFFPSLQIPPVYFSSRLCCLLNPPLHTWARLKHVMLLLPPLPLLPCAHCELSLIYTGRRKMKHFLIAPESKAETLKALIPWIGASGFRAGWIRMAQPEPASSSLSEGLASSSPLQRENLLLLLSLLSPPSSLELQMRPSCPNGLGRC